MAEKGTISVLERKLAAGEADRGNGRSALRALRLALARTAKDLYDLPLAVIGAKQARCEQAAAEGFLANDRLLVLLDGARAQAGAVSLDSACVAALIQQQTMGRVTGSAMAERDFTGTDAALAEPLIELLLSRAADLADSPDDRRCLGGFRFGVRVEDVRSLMLMLEADRFRVFDLTVDIAEGAMQGAVCLVLPDLPPETGKDGCNGADTGPRLDQGFGVMRADLTAMIGRLRMSLTDLARLRPGDVLPLTRERLEETQLVSITGKPVAAGRLGQVNGLRAVRLNAARTLSGAVDTQSETGFAANVTETHGSGPLALETPGDPVLPGDVEGVATKSGDDLPIPGARAGDLPERADLPVPVPVPVPVPAPVANGDGVIDAAADEGEELLARMTPEQAAMEITQLAGLEPDAGDG